MKKKLIALILVAVSLLMVLSGCGSQSGSSGSGNTGSEAASDTGTELTDFNIILDWYPNAIHEFLYWAIEKGYFADVGLNVTLTAPANATDPLTLVAAGKADAGIYYPKDVVVAYADENVPICAFGSILQGPVGVFCALADKGYNSPADWKGATIGYSGVASERAIINAATSYCGLSENDYQVVDVGFELITALTTGAVDVTSGNYLNHEVQEMIHDGYDVDYWLYPDYGAPDDYGMVFVANKDTLAANREKYANFLSACEKGFEDMKNDPEGSLDLIMSVQDEANFPLDADVEQMSYDILIDQMETENGKFLSMSLDAWEQDISFLKEYGLLKNDCDPSDFVVTDLLN